MSSIPIQIFNANIFCNETDLPLMQDILRKINFLKHGIYLNYGCKCSDNILKMASLLNNFQSFNHWLILEKTNSTKINSTLLSINQLSKLNINVESDITLAVSNNQLLLYDIYNPGYLQGGKLSIAPYGRWNAKDNVIISNLTSTKYWQRINFHDVLLQSATVMHHKPENISIQEYAESPIDTDTDTFPRCSYNLIMHLKDVHNFRINITVTSLWFGPDGGETKGVQKMLIDKTIDLSATPALMKADRVDTMDWFIPLWPFRTCFIFQNPRTSKYRNIFISPFTTKLWYSLLAISVLFVMAISLNLSTKENSFFNGSVDCWCSAILITVGAFGQQGFWLNFNHGYSTKCCLITLSMVSLLTYNYYTSSIVSSLLNAHSIVLHTINDLARSQLSVAFEDQPYTKTLFKVTKDPDIQLLYNEKVATLDRNPYITPSEGIKLVEFGGWAYHAEPTILYSKIAKTFDAQKICQLEEINLFPPAKLLFMAQKNGPFTKYFTISFRRMIAAGLFNRQLNIWNKKRPECMINQIVTQVDFSPTVPAFALLFFGIILSFWILFCEYLNYSILNKSKSKGTHKIKPIQVRVAINRKLKSQLKKSSKHTSNAFYRSRDHGVVIL